MRTLFALGLATSALALVGCNESGSDTSAAAAGDQLARPLDLPALVPGARCPRARSKEVNPAFGQAIGEGPVYAVLGANATLEFIYPAVEGMEWYPSDWSGQKVLWVVDPSYRGEVLVRGGRIDRPGRLGFGAGRIPEWHMKLDPQAPGAFAGNWPNFPSYTRLKANGCYAYQVDGRSFSYTIVFLARRFRN